MSTIQNITLPLFDDLHTHLRQDQMMINIVNQTALGGVGRVMVMPNLIPPVVNTQMALDYKSQLQSVNNELEYLMSLYLSDSQTPEEIAKAKQNGINNVKMYPAGVTTNSQYGVDNVKNFYPIFEAMQDNNMILNIHGEAPSDPKRNICVMNAEINFLPIFEQIHKNFPKLRLVLEHMSTKEAIGFVSQTNDKVAGSITVHHLDLIVDNWGGNAYNYCKPVPKYPIDRQALRDMVASGSPKFFLGSDSAPHDKDKKDSNCGCAGVYTATYIAQYLADCFERIGCLDKLKGFATEYGADFYQLPRQTKTFELVRKPTVVANELHGVVPFRAGETLNWSIER
jgi:dihydroorotase